MSTLAGTHPDHRKPEAPDSCGIECCDDDFLVITGALVSATDGVGPYISCHMACVCVTL